MIDLFDGGGQTHRQNTFKKVVGGGINPYEMLMKVGRMVSFIMCKIDPNGGYNIKHDG